MQKHAFALKRAFQSTLRFFRFVLQGTGLTVARYDMLMAVKGEKHGMSQKRLRQVLGVTRATVSKMLRSLEALGLVRREVNPWDRRRKDVWLTEEGAARLEATYKKIVRPGWVRFALAWVLGTRQNGNLLPPPFCDDEMMELDRHLWAIRRGFCDTGSLSYAHMRQVRAPRRSAPGVVC
jgi:DNA-binding MarR family transcriptional regulator